MVERATPALSGDDPPAALTADRLTHRYRDRLALNDVSFTVNPGSYVAVIGPNGAGKTTLLQILAGTLAPSSGTVTRPAERGAVGWVPQEVALYAKLTVAENLALFARLERVSDVSATVARMLEQTELTDRADDRLGSLSGGNRQRVNIAVGLLAEPSVLLMDEPGSSLDPRQRARLWEFVGTLTADGTSIVYATHDLPEAREHADTVLALEEGRLVFHGPATELQWSY